MDDISSQLSPVASDIVSQITLSNHDIDRHAATVTNAVRCKDGNEYQCFPARYGHCDSRLLSPSFVVINRVQDSTQHMASLPKKCRL